MQSNTSTLKFLLTVMELSAANGAAAVGAFTILWTVCTLCSSFWIYIRPSSLPRYLRTQNGSEPWALITGASDGIGKAFAAELASRGFNIVLHGRNPDKLGGVRQELESTYSDRRFRVAVANAKDLSEENLKKVVLQVEDITLKVLINNAGSTMARGHEYDTIDNYSSRELEDNIAVNGTFPILLTGALMAKLAANEPSLILNVGSIASIGMPLFPAYGPAKAMLMASTAQLAMDQVYTGRDIEVVMMRIGLVAQTGTIVAPPSVLAPDAPTWVKSALSRVGCGRTEIFPYIPHAIQALVLQGLPDFIGRKMKIQGLEEQIEADVTGARAEVAAARNSKKKL